MQPTHAPVCTLHTGVGEAQSVFDAQ